MARKTAMGKEPGNVSIALPQSEKDRLRGSGRRMPAKPRPMDDKGTFTDKQSLDRVSPGVYRNSQGKLVGSKGQALPKSSPIQNALQGAARAAGMQGNAQPAPRPNQRLPQQPMSQQEIDLANQAMNRINDTLNQYPVPKSPMDPGFGPNATLADLQNLYPNEDMNRQIFGGPAMTTGFGPKPYPMQNQMYPFPQGQQMPIQDLAYRPPAGTPRLTEEQMQRIVQRQQQAAQQASSVSGMLQQRGQQQSQAQQSQQGIVANRQPIAASGQMSPAELQAMQNGTFKGYAY